MVVVVVVVVVVVGGCGGGDCSRVLWSPLELYNIDLTMTGQTVGPSHSL